MSEQEADMPFESTPAPIPAAEVFVAPDDVPEPDGDDHDDDETPMVENRIGEAALPFPEEPAPQRLKRLRDKARTLPTTPGVYLMKDTRGVVIYVGKSRTLRDRVSSYFVPSTDLGRVKQLLLDYVTDFDTLNCETEVEALLMENRLIKDIQPRFNARLTDDKTFPYLEITTRDDFPGVYITRQPSKTGTKLYGPFTSSGTLREAMTHLQRAFKFRTCHLEISADDPKNRFFRPCLLYAIKQCSAPCANKIGPEAYANDVEHLKKFLDSKRSDYLREATREMEECSKAMEFEKAAALRDQIRALRALGDRGERRDNMQPEVFFQDHGAGLKQLQDILEIPEPIRSIEGIDIAHFQGEATVGSLVCFIDGRPFKNGYKRFRIKTVTGVNDYASIQEVVSRRYRDAGHNGELYPDVILIDGGLGQLHAAQDAFSQMDVRPPMVISLAKREEEIFVQARKAAIKLPRTSHALKLLQHIRDEAHRFGQNYHHLLIKKRRLDADVSSGRAAPKMRKPRKKTLGDQTPLVAADDTPEFKVIDPDALRKLAEGDASTDLT